VVALSEVAAPRRLAVVRETGLLDAPEPEGLRRLVRLARRVVAAPIALVSVVEVDRQFFAAGEGLPEPWASRRGTPIAYSFCRQVVERRAPLVITDAERHPLVAAHPPLRELGVAAYAGMPLRADGETLGALCAMAPRPRAWSADDLATLEELAAVAGSEIERRLEQRAWRRTEARRWAEARLAAARAEQHGRDQFLTGVAHALKTPLTVIKGRSQLAARRIASRTRSPEADDGLVRGLTEIAATSSALAELVDEILAPAREGERPRTESPMPSVPGSAGVDLLSLVHAAAAAARQRTVRHAIEVVEEAGAAPLASAWHGEQLGRALDLLLTNAIAYSPDGGTITVAITGAGDGSAVEVAVRDGGIGISPADLPRIFDRFHRGANVADRIAGIGIGLATARRIVEEHGGTISAASVEGAGSTFTIRLPLADPAPVPAAEPAPAWERAGYAASDAAATLLV